MIRKLSGLAFCALLAGCSISQNVKPVARLDSSQVCVVNNPAVSQDGFLATYVRVLSEKGYSVKQLPAGSPVTECPVTSTYTANWRWDLAMYMAYADIKVYKNGELTGQATYDSLHGGANLGKFIKGETKIAELVEKLFPGRAGDNHQ